MTAFVARRLAFLPLLWLGVTLMIFALLAPLGPYDRLSLYVSQDPSKLTMNQTPEALKRLIATYGLDDPFYVQYAHWLANVLHGDLGWSRTDEVPVTQALRNRLPATLELALFAAVPMLLLAVFLGVRSAVAHNTWLDHALRFTSVLTLSIPPFVLGVCLLVLLYGALPWFPPARLSVWAERVVLGTTFTRYTGMNTVDAVLNGRLDICVDALRHLVLPVVTLAALGWGGLMRITRSAMLEAVGQDYVTAARAKGVPERHVVNHHALRNAMVPITTAGVFVVIGLLGGAVFVETVFRYPGIGKLTADATAKLDVPTVIGVTLLGATVVVLGNLAADLLYAVLDPRIRYQ